jgi:hypothetical protein
MRKEESSLTPIPPPQEQRFSWVVWRDHHEWHKLSGRDSSGEILSLPPSVLSPHIAEFSPYFNLIGAALSISLDAGFRKSSRKVITSSCRAWRPIHRSVYVSHDPGMCCRFSRRHNADRPRGPLIPPDRTNIMLMQAQYRSWFRGAKSPFGSGVPWCRVVSVFRISTREYHFARNSSMEIAHR